MKRVFLISMLSLFIFGCASTQATRKAQYLSENYADQTQKNIYVLSVIDARIDKTKDMQELLSNKNVRSYFISNVLSGKGYKSQLIDIDTGKCGSLKEVSNISEMTCLDSKTFQNGDAFLFISIDEYVAPGAMHVVGKTKVTGVFYSKSSNSFIWKDSIEGNYADTGGNYGLGAFAGMLLLKAMSQDFIFRNNAYSAIKELLKSVPPFPAKK